MICANENNVSEIKIYELKFIPETIMYSSKEMNEPSYHGNMLVNIYNDSFNLKSIEFIDRYYCETVGTMHAGGVFYESDLVQGI